MPGFMCSLAKHYDDLSDDDDEMSGKDAGTYSSQCVLRIDKTFQSSGPTKMQIF